MELKYGAADPIHQEFPSVSSVVIPDDGLDEEIDNFLLQQAAEDAYLPEGQRHQQVDLVRQLLIEQLSSDHERVDELLGRYLGRIASYRGEEAAQSDQPVSLDVDLSKIGWIHDQTKEGKYTVVKGEHIETLTMEYDFVDLIPMSKGASHLFESLSKQEDVDKILDRIKQDAIPKLWYDITSGRGRQRPISVGTTQDIAQAARAGRTLDTEYAGYKIDVNGTNNRAIVLILGRNDDSEPQVALVALYDHDDQDRIWSEMMIRGIGSKT